MNVFEFGIFHSLKSAKDAIILRELQVQNPPHHVVCYPHNL